MIGIVGGLGPEAGNYLYNRIIKFSCVSRDIDHFNTCLISSNKIPDRTAFLLGKSIVNPSKEISKVINDLITVGSRIIVIACNQVYDRRIFLDIVNSMDNNESKNVILIDLLQEVELYKKLHRIKKLGVLSRTGLYKARSIEGNNKSKEDSFIYLNHRDQEELDEIIGSRTIGIKSGFHNISPLPRRIVLKCIDYLNAQNVDVTLLACTELALVLTEEDKLKYRIADTNEILAEAVVREATKYIEIENNL